MAYHARIMHCSLNGTQLLILDDWGLEPLDGGARRNLYEILEERAMAAGPDHPDQPGARRQEWHEVIGNPTIADAVLDRLVHNAHRINLDGDSLRRTCDHDLPQKVDPQPASRHKTTTSRTPLKRATSCRNSERH